jgi:hypothetical protein
MSGNEPQFKKEEVWAVARAIGSGLYVDESGMNAHQICMHCRETRYYSWNPEPTAESFVHLPQCPVLIARDILTGASKE